MLVTPASSELISAAAELPLLADKAATAHALAVVNGIERPGTSILHTGPVGFPGKDSSIPVLDMAKQHRQLLARLVQEGRAPRLTIDVASHFTEAPVQETNIVGEIAGTLHPDEVILVGAHLDSWDLSAGATDDGTGVAAVLSVANAIRASGVRTSRTIRFVLFTGEEQGLLGSQAYVKQHETELSGLVCALILDWGAGPITKFPLAGHLELKRPLENFLPVSATLAA